ncbi:SDR family NAD(P)-dependent oxidoreductase [Novosphingobium sp. B 225]|uniref:SDR family NAD(P)-dependent oxidoreductase n=1 Tax=Novosphingobium sp. B 225 TaxID=1961849 RepID=UPI000B4C1067|nr:SDR family NAD(P)-dependent oxidoreductase [Novosphingobium sp. B 225]
MQNLEGKTAFVTGGASGIGLGIAKALLGAGMNVAIADIRQDHLDAASAELDGGERVLALQLDVTNRAQFAEVADAAEAKFGKLHVLIANAGVGLVGPSELATFADWDWVNGVNVGGAINGVVTLLPRILSHGEGGHIVCTASMSALVPVGGTAIYSAGKAYVTSMMECMRPELEGRGVICSAFCPGAVQSNIAESGKTRPAELAETGYAEADKRRQASGDLRHLFQTKEEVGERVLQGILNDELYILTHHEFLDGVRERGEATTLAVQDHLPENPEYKGTFAMLFKNPAITQEIERQTALKAARKG